MATSPENSADTLTPAALPAPPTVRTLQHTIRCAYSNLVIGQLTLSAVAGHMPYLSHWKEQIAYHPVFSLSQPKLLAFTRNEWQRLAKRAADEEITPAESNILCVSFLALLHSMGSIEQLIPALPPLHVVQANVESLFALTGWQHYLDSKRFTFPSYRITKYNNNSSFENIHDYLNACWERKREYETAVDEVQEKHKLQLAEKALLAIRSAHIKPVGRKLLWRWVVAHLPAMYHADAQGWMGTLFLGNAAAILAFDLDEIELLQEIIESSCPIGNSIMFAVKERIADIFRIHKEHYDTFTLEDSQEEVVAAIATESPSLVGSPEPLLSEFPTKASFFIAHAKWTIANKKLSSATKTTVATSL